MLLEISSKAQLDIASMHPYGLEQFGQTRADEYSVKLFDLFELIQKNPRMAVEMVNFKRRLRMLRYRRHLVFYRLSVRKILILRVLHGTQNWVDKL